MNPLSSSQIDQLRQLLPTLVERESMIKHTSFHMGGEARMYIVATTSEMLLEAVRAAQHVGVPWYIFGGGSNLLVADQGFEGLMIQVANHQLKIEGMSMYVESGVVTALAARKSVEAGLTGFEWASGVPGTIGGALFGNAGCFGGEMRDAVTRVDALRVADGQRVALTNAECQFGYRGSRFKQEQFVLLGCELTLKTSDDPAASRARLDEITKRRQEDQPQGQSSAGCVFKNFEYTDEQALDLLKRHVDEIPASMLAGHRIGAGWLVEQAD